MQWISQPRSKRHLQESSRLCRQLLAKLDHQDHQVLLGLLETKDHKARKARQEAKAQQEDKDKTVDVEWAPKDQILFSAEAAAVEAEALEVW